MHETSRFTIFHDKHPGQIFSRRELYDYVWEDYYELGGGETVKSHIKALHKKLAGLGRDVIETVLGVGYQFAPARIGAKEESG